MTALTASPDTVSRPSAARVVLARARARHPEWWVVAVALAAWGVVVAPYIWPDQSIAVHHHAEHHMPSASTSAAESYLHAVTAWTLMILAMMLLVGVPRVRYVAAVCPGRIRIGAIAQTVAGIVGVWLVLGAAVSVIPVVVPTARGAAFVAVWLAAAAWQLTPWKWAALRRCHGVRVPRRDGDGRARVRMGAVHGTWCVVSCGPAMVAMVVTGHPLLLMVGLTFGLATERVAMRPARAIRLVAATTTLLAMATAGAVALGA